MSRLTVEESVVMFRKLALEQEVYIEPSQSQISFLENLDGIPQIIKHVAAMLPDFNNDLASLAAHVQNGTFKELDQRKSVYI